MAKIKILNSESSDVSNLFELALSGLDYSKERIVHYTLLVEEALLTWQERLPSDTEILIKREDTSSHVFFSIEAKGEKIDPFDVKKSEDEFFSMEKVRDRLMSGVGSEIRYKYKKGVNRIGLRLPKQNQEKKLFRYNIILLMIPIAIQTLMATIATNVDTFMLGFLDADKMSAVSLTSVFVTIPIMFVTSITSGATVYIAQLWGKRDRDGIDQIASFSTLLTILVTTLFFLASAIFPEKIIGLYTSEKVLIAEGAKYLRWLSPSFIITGYYRMLFSFMQSTGGVKKALKYSLVGCGCNVLLNGIFIFGTFGGHSLGVAGAALATNISAIVQAVLARRDLKKFSTISINLFRKYTIKFKPFFECAIPIILQTIIWTLANNINNAAIGHMGVAIVTANSIMLILYQILLSTREGLGKAVGIVLGGYLGKNQLDLAKMRSKDSMIVGGEFALVLMPIFFIMGYLLRFLPIDFSPDALHYLNILLVVYTIEAFFCFMNGVLVFGILNSGVDSKALLVIDTIVMWCIMVPIALLSIFTKNVIPLIVALIILRLDEVISFPLKYIRCKQYKWVRNITK